jgi:hypothetical protein
MDCGMSETANINQMKRLQENRPKFTTAGLFTPPSFEPPTRNARQPDEPQAIEGIRALW